MVSSPQAAKQRAAALRRVAIVLSSLPAPVATRLLAGVDADAKRQLRRAMTSLADVDPMERRMALQNFAGSLKQSQAAPAGAASDDEVSLRHSPGAPGSAESAANHSTANEASPHPSQDPPTSPLTFLSDVDDDRLIEMVGSEHPQTIALVLASIAPAQAARLLPRLEPEQRHEAMSRIGRLGEIPDEALGEIAQHLRGRVDQQAAAAEKTASGRRALDAILAELAPVDSHGKTPAVAPVVNSAAPGAGEHAPRAGGPEAAGQIDRLRGIGQLGIAGDHGVAGEVTDDHAGRDARHNGPAKGGATDDVRSPAFRRNAEQQPAEAKANNDAASWPTDEIHDHLVGLVPADLCRALAQVDTRDALLTLCGLPTETAEAAIRTLPRAAAKQVRRSLAALGSLQLREIDRAKEKVADASLKASLKTRSSAAAARPDEVPMAA